MPIDFSCPHCGQAIRVPDESAGRSGRCPKCKQPVTVPSPAASAASAPPVAHLSPFQDAPRATTSTTPVLVVEVAGTGIDWMEPRDLDFTKMSYHINDGSGRGIQCGHPGRACILFCEGSVHRVSQTIAPELLKGLISCDGGEVVGQYSLDP